MKTYISTREELEMIGPEQFAARLKAAGFRMLSVECPIKIAQPWKCTEREDGTVVFAQYDLN